MRISHHFVLTRFNIASPGREASIRNSPGWLERRFRLFEDYCLPSMAAQTQGKFRWLIYFDEGTPSEFRERIELARQKVPFDPIFVGPFRASLAAEDVAARLQDKSGRLITTRLDNDDAVADDFLECTRAECERYPDGTILNFRDGIALSDGKLFEAADESNPFTSLVEQAEGAETIWAAPHTELAQRFSFKQVTGEPFWLQVIHGENVANRIKGKRLVDKEVLQRFALSDEVRIEPTGRLEIAIDRAIHNPLRQGRELAIKIAKSLIRHR